MPSETELRDRAAIERTRLANERTLLAYVRTALAVVVSGLGLQLVEGVNNNLGAAVILIGALVIPFGFWRYLRMRKRIG